jgi:hypothetical protein
MELRRRIITPGEAREVWEDWGGLHPRGDWPEEGQQLKISGGAVDQADSDAGRAPGEQQFVNGLVADGWTH